MIRGITELKNNCAHDFAVTMIPYFLLFFIMTFFLGLYDLPAYYWELGAVLIWLAFSFLLRNRSRSAPCVATAQENKLLVVTIFFFATIYLGMVAFLIGVDSLRDIHSQRGYLLAMFCLGFLPWALSASAINSLLGSQISERQSTIQN